MRLRRFLILCAIIVVPALTHGEILYLKDGSKLQGKLVKMVSDTLFFETSFGSRIRIPKNQVSRLDFDETASIPPPSGAAVVPMGSTAVGTVFVSFDNVKVSSKIAVHRNKNKDALLRANAIECAFYVGSEKVYSVIDSVIDKSIREGPETRYQNDMEPEDFSIAVPAGLHQCRLFLRNLNPGDHEDAFIDAPLEQMLFIEEVNVQTARATHYRVGIKRKMKIGKAQLVLFE